MVVGAGPRVVIIVVFDGVKLLGAAGPAEVFAEANRFGVDYLIRIAALDDHEVTTSIGTKFPVTERISDINHVDTVLVAGGDNLVGRPIDPELTGQRARGSCLPMSGASRSAMYACPASVGWMPSPPMRSGRSKNQPSSIGSKNAAPTS